MRETSWKGWEGKGKVEGGERKVCVGGNEAGRGRARGEGGDCCSVTLSLHTRMIK